MELLLSNGWAQLLLLIVTGTLCVCMSLWLGTQHFRIHQRLPGVPARATLTTVPVIDAHTPTLRITNIVQHGRIVEIKGVTDAGTVVMINGEPVATIFPENSFRHFIGPLPKGTTIVSITCQDERGGVNTQRLAVTLE
jgi:hypothetical protein